MSKPLTFGELLVGESFIGFPLDGDDEGHGGYRQGSYVFIKTKPMKTEFKGYFINAKRSADNNMSAFPDTMQILKIIT